MNEAIAKVGMRPTHPGEFVREARAFLRLSGSIGSLSDARAGSSLSGTSSIAPHGFAKIPRLSGSIGRWSGSRAGSILNSALCDRISKTRQDFRGSRVRSATAAASFPPAGISIVVGVSAI
jgi:hypothetical protein